MNVRAVQADAAYVLRSWARSRSGVVVSLGMPLILLLALGYLVQPGEAPLPAVEVVDHAGTPEARRLVDALLASASLDVRETDAALAGGGPGADVAARMRSEGLAGRIEILEGFDGAPGGVRAVVDGASAARADAVLATLDAALARTAAATAAEAAASADGGGEGEGGAQEAPAGVAVERVALPETEPYAYFLLPGVVGLTVLMTGLPAGFASVAELRHAGLLERLAVSPMTKREWLLARMLGASVVALLAASLLVFSAWLVLDVTPHLTPWTLLLVVGGTLVFSGLGVLLGTAVSDPTTGGAVMNLVLLPIVMLSGSFFDVSRLPGILSQLALVSPLTHLNRGLRADMLAGDSTAAALHAGGIGLAALAVLTLGSFLVRWSARE